MAFSWEDGPPFFKAEFEKSRQHNRLVPWFFQGTLGVYVVIYSKAKWYALFIHTIYTERKALVYAEFKVKPEQQQQNAVSFIQVWP